MSTFCAHKTMRYLQPWNKIRLIKQSFSVYLFNDQEFVNYMVPMRDGVRLFTLVLYPTNHTRPVPILILRTPYGSDFSLKEDSALNVDRLPPNYASMAKEGYVLVVQDMRGKFKSEGSFEMSRPLYHLTDKTKTDESTDAWDTVDWLIKNIKNNNGKAGIWGVSYPGYMALDASVDPHPAYDVFWKKQSSLTSIHVTQIPTLHVGGYYDQEDLNGPQIMYNQLEKKDSLNRNYIVLGPWNHGQWTSAKADSLGKIGFGSKTAIWFQNLQKKWFDYWLKGIGDGRFAEAYCFQTGTNAWKEYNNWPPRNVEIKRFYALADNSAGFSKPISSKGSVSYVSDPAKPVPYRTRHIEATYGFGSRWDSWQVEDQRFVSSRPDVVSFTGDSLKESLTITGKVVAHIFASTSATDADFVVKLIDVYPDIDSKNILMSGYQLPVAMEVFRGRFRKSFEKPEPLTSNKPEEFIIDLHQINHTFLKGHHLMMQIQSTWFPIIDRNPQKYVPNIFEARESDFIKATQTIYCNDQYSSYIELPVMTK